AFVESLHALVGRADAGQDDAFGGANHCRIGREFAAHPEAFERKAHRSNVGTAAVYNRKHQRTPFELGMSPPAPRATAGRSARPKPLNRASIMWCVLSPMTFMCSVAARLSLTDLKKCDTI